MALNKFVNITSAELKAKGVVSLADKPNVSSSYGVGGLSATNLKLWFDQIGKFIAEKINIIQDALSGDDAASYLKLNLDGLYTDKETSSDFSYSLQDLCDSLLDGKFAEFLQLYESAADSDLQSLQTIINNIAASISSENEALAEYKKLLASNEGSENIGLPDKYDSTTGKTLSDLIDDIFNCNLAAKIVIETLGISASTKTAKYQKTLQTYIDEITTALQAENSSVLLDLINDRYTKSESDSLLEDKVTSDISTHNTSTTAHSNIMALKFNLSDVMASFEGEDTQNTAKVPSAAALSDVIEQINSNINTVDDKAELSIKSVDYDSETGVIVFTKTNGNTITFDLPSEKILKAGASYYDTETEELHLVLMDDSDIVIDVSSLVDEYFGDDETIELTSVDGNKTFTIKASYKAVLDGYGTTLDSHTEELERLEEDKVNVSDIVDNLITEAADKPVSANQAKVLKDTIDSLNTTLKGTYCSVSYDNTTGTFKLTKTDGDVDTINFPLESFVEDASFDSTTNTVTLTVANGESVSFDLSALIDYYYGDNETIEVYDDADDGYKHKIRVKSTFLDSVNSEISALDSRVSQTESDISNLKKIEEYGSIGIADGDTITMDDDTGYLSARKLKLADDTILTVLPITKAEYNNLSTPDENTLYLINDDSRLDVIIGGLRLFSQGVKDTETNESIVFRVITKSAYDGLSTKESNKLYIINNEGSLAFAFGDWYLDTNSELLNSLQERLETLEEETEDLVSEITLIHSTLSGTDIVAVFSSLSIDGLSLTSGTLESSERCLQC